MKAPILSVLRISISLALLASLMLPGRAAEPRGIPFKPDPPPAVDGQLEEWANVPGALDLNRADQATWGAASWKSPADLGAKVWLAWRPDALYLAAEVSDDKLKQTQRGANIWKGDCVQLYLDLAPDVEPTRLPFGKGQFQIVFSPGNFRQTGDPLADCPPELYCVKPAGCELKDAVVAARKTDRGYTIEAGIPWSALGIAKPAACLPVHFEVAVFDTDGDEPRSEKLLSFSSKPWKMDRARLNQGALAGADGQAPPVVRTAPLFEKVDLKPQAKQSVKFTAAKTPEGKEAILALKARMDTPKVAGYTPALKLTLNGTALEGKRLLNKPLEVQGSNGRMTRLAAVDRFTTFYAPNFTSADASSYALPGVKTCEFELRVGDLLREGQNELIIQNACMPNVTRSLIAANASLSFGTPPPPPRQKAGPPTGPLAAYAPAREHKVAYRLSELPGAKLVVELNGEKFTIASRFSTPAGKWETGGNAFFSHSRQIERQAETILVRETFKNLTPENLPIMQRHETTAASSFKKIWLAGLSPAGLVGTATAPENPTSYGITEKAGLGLLPLNDEFQVHVANYAANGTLGLADNQFVLQPGQSYTAEWAIVPVLRPDNFDFINAARRLRDANFTIAYCFAFLRGGPLSEKRSDAELADFIKFKSANLLCHSIMSPMYQGRYSHGLAFQMVKHDSYKKIVERVHRLAPQAKTCVYFHCYIDAEENAAAKFPEARILRGDGSHADYGKAFYGLFFPTETNAYGRAVRRNVDLILNDIKADGVYWDELEYSAYAYHYGQPWDGCSADIDAQTMKIQRLKSSVTLLTQPWRVALIQEIMARGPFIANGQPHTRTMGRLKYPRFCETGSRSNCTRGQLHSPIALGDHLTERSEEDAYHNMVSALDYGCLYHWYNDQQVIPTYETLTKYMYPITPVELHEGYILAQERILSNRSGLFGWGDAAVHEVHVFDDTGREVPNFKAPTVTRDGATFTELRLAEGWSAAIVRK